MVFQPAAEVVKQCFAPARDASHLDHRSGDLDADIAGILGERTSASRRFGGILSFDHDLGVGRDLEPSAMRDASAPGGPRLPATPPVADQWLSG